jgi:MFS family permease
MRPIMSSSAVPVRALAPGLIIVAGCLCAMLTFGPRSAMGFFQQPIITANGWGRDTFAFALAVQNLIWGMGQPFMGAIADRFGTVRVLSVGALLYAAGLALMAVSTTPLSLDLTAGVLIGLGLAGCSFNIVLAAFGKLLPPEKRSMAFGFGTAAGSFGQFFFSPLGVALIRDAGWQNALYVFALMMLLVLPLSLAVATPPVRKAAAQPGEAPAQNVRQALLEAFRHHSYVLLVLGFFTCGFQLAFITVHLPAYMKDVGLTAEIGALTLAAIGIFNIIGSLLAGYLGNRMPKRWILAFIYLARSVVTIGLLLAIPYGTQPITLPLFGVQPLGALIALVFGAFTGLLWLSTVPPTSSLVSIMFGTRYMAMLYGFAFFSHQVGAFLGVWLGGVLFERTGSYDIVWWLSVALGIASAAINLPISEKPVARPAPVAQPA